MFQKIYFHISKCYNISVSYTVTHTSRIHVYIDKNIILQFLTPFSVWPHFNIQNIPVVYNVEKMLYFMSVSHMYEKFLYQLSLSIDQAKFTCESEHGRYTIFSHKGSKPDLEVCISILRGYS